jgi:NADH-quinone oxidoreductase subunit G
MPKLIIDDREVEVPTGVKVIEAAARLGIMIPRFCYHPALGSVGACRACAVKVMEGPVKGLQMSCMLEVADGMKISTTEAEAVAFRRYVIEWLMLNHPHDCPVCDEGGHCLLQDMTVSGGHCLRRYPGNKRTYTDQDLGPLVQHEMNRCIHCYRCVRFYQQFCGYRDFGALGIGNRTYFGRVTSGHLESPFAGNLSDLCPTGVFTDKPSRFFGRRWDYQRTPTVCISCSLGCHMVTSVRYRQVVRQEARQSESVNGWFLCDRGRYGFFYASLPDRPRQATLKGEAASMDAALLYAVSRLEELPPDAVAVIGSVRSSLESLAMTAYAAQRKGWRGPAFFADAEAVDQVKGTVLGLDANLAVSLAQIEAADVILVVGADPLNEAPMSALAIRQAVQKKAKAIVLDPRPIWLPCDFTHFPVAAGSIATLLGGLLKKSIDPAGLDPVASRWHASLPDGAAMQLPEVASVLDLLAGARRPVIVCGTDIVGASTLDFVTDAVRMLAAAHKEAGLFCILPGANAFAAGLAAQPTTTTAEILQAVVEGDIKALILVENDPYSTFFNRDLLDKALAKTSLLIVLDYLDTTASRRADVFLPSQTLYEAGGIFINQEGRAQYSLPVYRGGAPILATGAGGHPPRVYGVGLPGADPQPAGQIMARLAGELISSENQNRREAIAGFASVLKELPDPEVFPEDGMSLPLEKATEGGFKTIPPPAAAEAEDFAIILSERTFGTEELSSYSACLKPVTEEPFAGLHRQDAEALGIQSGDRLAIRTADGSVELVARVFDRMALNHILIPRLRSLPWQLLGKRIRRQDIRKA